MMDMNPWHPMSNPVDLKTMGKLNEELGECTAAVSRCLIQGIDEAEPTTGKANRDWLEDEIADVLAGFDITIERFGLDMAKIAARTNRKKTNLRAWHVMA